MSGAMHPIRAPPGPRPSRAPGALRSRGEAAQGHAVERRSSRTHAVARSGADPSSPAGDRRQQAVGNRHGPPRRRGRVRKGRRARRRAQHRSPRPSESARSAARGAAARRTSGNSVAARSGAGQSHKLAVAQGATLTCSRRERFRRGRTQRSPSKSPPNGNVGLAATERPSRVTSRGRWGHRGRRAVTGRRGGEGGPDGRGKGVRRREGANRGKTGSGVGRVTRAWERGRRWSGRGKRSPLAKRRWERGAGESRSGVWLGRREAHKKGQGGRKGVK